VLPIYQQNDEEYRMQLKKIKQDHFGHKLYNGDELMKKTIMYIAPTNEIIKKISPMLRSLYYPGEEPLNKFTISENKFVKNELVIMNDTKRIKVDGIDEPILLFTNGDYARIISCAVDSDSYKVKFINNGCNDNIKDLLSDDQLSSLPICDNNVKIQWVHSRYISPGSICTNHKAQGKGADVVINISFTKTRFVSKKMMLTVIGRAKRELILLGPTNYFFGDNAMQSKAVQTYLNDLIKKSKYVQIDKSLWRENVQECEMCDNLVHRHKYNHDYHNGMLMCLECKFDM
jgi:hypothetical protein